MNYASPITMSNGGAVIDVAGPVPSILSGQLIGGNSTAAADLNVGGAGILVVTNSANNFAGGVTVTQGAMLQAASAGVLGNPAAASSYTLQGTLDLNGNSFSGRTWLLGLSNMTGPLGLPNLINSNTASTATFGNANDIYNIDSGSGIYNTMAIIGGPGNIILPGKFAGEMNNNSTYLLKGTGTVTMTGDAANVFATGANYTMNETVQGMTLVLNYSSDTSTKILTGVTPVATTATQQFNMYGGALQLVGNATTAVSEHLPIIGGDYLAAASATGANAVMVGLDLTGGMNSVKLTTAGQNLTLNAGGITPGNGAVDFSVNTIGGGTAGINFGSSGLGVGVTAGGSGYAPSQTNIPITISAPNTPGGVQAIGHAVSSANGVITAVYIDNWGSGYTANPTVSIGGGGSGATAALYFNNPTTGIIGGYATYGGSDWAYRDANGNIQPLPAGSYSSDPASYTAIANSSSGNVSLDSNNPWTNVTSSVTLSTLRFAGTNATSANTLSISSGTTLTLGYNTANVTQTGGILVTAAVGAQNITINGGSLTGESTVRPSTSTRTTRPAR